MLRSRNTIDTINNGIFEHSLRRGIVFKHIFLFTFGFNKFSYISGVIRTSRTYFSLSVTFIEISLNYLIPTTTFSFKFSIFSYFSIVIPPFMICMVQIFHERALMCSSNSKNNDADQPRTSNQISITLLLTNCHDFGARLPFSPWYKKCLPIPRKSFNAFF